MAQTLTTKLALRLTVPSGRLSPDDFDQYLGEWGRQLQSAIEGHDRAAYMSVADAIVAEMDEMLSCAHDFGLSVLQFRVLRSVQLEIGANRW